MKTPDITPAEVVALVGGALDVAVQFGARVTPGQAHALLAFLGLLAAVVLGNAHIRHGRASASKTLPVLTDGGVEKPAGPSV